MGVNAAERRWSRRWTLVATIIGSSLTFIDGTVVNVALPALQADLQATITDVQWVIEAYALFLGSLILVGGSLGDQFGRKRTFLVGVTLFTIASMACGLAQSTRALIEARAAQGIGAAFLMPGSLAIISATFDDADRGRAIGTWSAFSSITAAIGPVLGGWLIEHVSWRAVFFLNVPLAATVVALSARFMAESRDASRTAQIDWAGAALAVLGLGGIVFFLLEWPNPDSSGPLVFASLLVGVTSLVALIVVERRVPAPMLPLSLFRSRTFTLANLLTLFLYSALTVVFWLVPLNLIQVREYSATAAGAALLPFPILMFLLSRWSGGLVASVGSRVPLTIGPIVGAAGLALFARTGMAGSYWTTFFPAAFVLGLGMAIVVAPLTATAMSAVETQHAGVASGVNNAVARVAGLVAIAVFGIVLVRSFDTRVRQALDRLELPEASRSAIDRELPKMAGADVDAVISGPQRTAVRRAVDESFVSAFAVVMNVAAGVALAAAAAGALIRQGDLGRNVPRGP
ncbi:MAG TPA: MFS transporter [Vicinamibacterales bacterium]|nr:MFS transporter [Vicinamibacterales bacterium]